MAGQDTNKTGSRFVTVVRLALAMVAIATLRVTNSLASTPTADPALFDRLDSDKNGALVAEELPESQRGLLARLFRKGDANDDGVLTREEFTEALVPTRPEKPLEEKQPATFPQANAVRWLLLSLDSDGDARIEQAEVEENLLRVFNNMAEKLDANKNGTLETMELARGGRPFAQIAGRYVQQNRIDVAEELQRIERRQGDKANRFEERQPRLEDLSDPQRARQLFVRLDTNSDGQLETREVPDPLQRPLQRLFRSSDRNGDGQLSEREFMAGVRRIAGRMGGAAGRPRPDSGNSKSQQDSPAKSE